MFFSESSKGTSLPTGFLAFCYGVALIGICAQINRLYVDANPMPAITVADDILQWMVGSAMVAGALAAWH